MISAFMKNTDPSLHNFIIKNKPPLRKPIAWGCKTCNKCAILFFITIKMIMKSRIIEPTFKRSPEIDNVIIDSMVSMKNEIFDSVYKDNHLKRIGHRGFLSLIWNLFRRNRIAKSSNKDFEITVKFPLKWFK